MRSMRTGVLLRAVLGVATFGALLGCAGAAEDTRDTTPTVVRMTGSGNTYQYEPARVLSTNGIIEFVNDSEMPHDVVWAEKTLGKSSLIKTGGRWRTTIKTSGEYAYICTLHPGMKGIIAVELP